MSSENEVRPDNQGLEIPSLAEEGEKELATVWLETGGFGVIKELKFKGWQGSIKVLEVGDLEQAQKAGLFFHAPATPSLMLKDNLWQLEDQLYSYYLPGFSELQKQEPETWAGVFLLNWPGYGKGNLDTNIETGEPYSFEEKKAIMLALAKWFCGKRSKVEELEIQQPQTIIASHSSAGAVGLRVVNELLGLDNNLKVVLEDPSGTAADTLFVRRYGKLAEKAEGPISLVVTAQKIMPRAVLEKILADSYDLPIELLDEDDGDKWIMASAKAVDARVMTRELAQESKLEAWAGEITDPKRVIVTAGEKEKRMIKLGELEKLAEEEWKVKFESIKGAGHLAVRQAPLKWAEVIAGIAS